MTTMPISPDRLRRARLHAGMTLDALAAAAQVSTSYVSMLERGARQPRNSDAVARILAALGFGSDGPPPPASSGQHPDDAELLLQSAWSLFSRGASAQALRLVEVVMQGRPAQKRLHSRVQQAIAVFQRDLGDLDAALRSGVLAVNLAREAQQDDVLGAALFRLGRIYDALGDRTRALHHAQQAMAYAPKARSPLRGYLYQQYADMASRFQALPPDRIEELMNQARRCLSAPMEDDSFVTLSPAGLGHDAALIAIRSTHPLHQVLDQLTVARATMPYHASRDRASLQCTEALAYASRGQVSDALTVASEILPVARTSTSQMRRIRGVIYYATQYEPKNPAVRAFVSRVQKG